MFWLNPGQYNSILGTLEGADIPALSLVDDNTITLAQYVASGGVVNAFIPGSGPITSQERGALASIYLSTLTTYMDAGYGEEDVAGYVFSGLYDGVHAISRPNPIQSNPMFVFMFCCDAMRCEDAEASGGLRPWADIYYDGDQNTDWCAPENRHVFCFVLLLLFPPFPLSVSLGSVSYRVVSCVGLCYDIIASHHLQSVRAVVRGRSRRDDLVLAVQRCRPLPRGSRTVP